MEFFKTKPVSLTETQLPQVRNLQEEGVDFKIEKMRMVKEEENKRRAVELQKREKLKAINSMQKIPVNRKFAYDFDGRILNLVNFNSD